MKTFILVVALVLGTMTTFGKVKETAEMQYYHACMEYRDSIRKAGLHHSYTLEQICDSLLNHDNEHGATAWYDSLSIYTMEEYWYYNNTQKTIDSWLKCELFREVVERGYDFDCNQEYFFTETDDRYMIKKAKLIDKQSLLLFTLLDHLKEYHCIFYSPWLGDIDVTDVQQNDILIDKWSKHLWKEHNDRLAYKDTNIEYDIRNLENEVFKLSSK